MTTYTATISTSPSGAFNQGIQSIEASAINDSGSDQFASSEDFEGQGVRVISGKTGDSRFVRTASDLAPDDIVRVQGIPMTVEQAGELGHSFEGKAPVTASQSTVEPQLDPNLEDPSFEEGLNPELDMRTEQSVTDAEVVAIDLAVDAVKMHTGLDQEATLELGKDILLGEIPQGDQVWRGLQSKGISEEAARSTVGNVFETAQRACLKELGADEYRELGRLADSNRAIKNLVIDHGIKRMTGKSKGVTYKQVLTLARQYARQL